MTSPNPFIPSEDFLERRSREMVDRERARQDAKHSWAEDQKLGVTDWLARIDRQRGQLAVVLIRGGRWGGFDRRLAIKELVQIGALARRAVSVLQAEIHETTGEHADDDLLQMFELPERSLVNAASPATDETEEVPF